MAYLKQNINVLVENFNIIKNMRKSIVYIIFWLVNQNTNLKLTFYNSKLEV